MLLAEVEVDTKSEVLGNLHVYIRTDIELIEVRRAVLVNTVLALAIELYEVSNALATAVDGYPVLVLCGKGLEDLFAPISVRVVYGVGTIGVCSDFGLCIDRLASGDCKFCIVCLCIERGICHLDDSCRLLQSHVIGEGDIRCIVELTAFSSDNNNAIRSTCTVDICGYILEDVHAFDFFTCKAGEVRITSLDTVDYDEGRVVSESTAATDEDGRIVTSRLAGTVADDDTCDTAGKTLGKVNGRVLHQIVTGC